MPPPPPQPVLVLLALLITSVTSFSRTDSIPYNRPFLHPHSSTTSTISTAIFSSTSTTLLPHQGQGKGKQSVEQDLLIKCQGCNESFKSRNALFRHLRGDDETSIDCPLAMGSMAAAEEELLMTAVIRFGYHGYVYGDTTESNAAVNENVVNMIHKDFVHRMNTFLDEEKNNGGEKAAAQKNFTVSTSALTYSTAAKLRQPSLRQDEEVVGAASEVLSFNYRLLGNPAIITKWKKYANSGQLQELMQAGLHDDDGNEGNGSQIKIQLHHMDALVPRSTKFYAERSFTQSSYRYLLPIEWILPSIDDSDNGTRRRDEMSQMEEWWKHVAAQSSSTSQRKHQPRSGGQGQSMSSPDSPQFIKRLKQSLKATESETVPNRRSRRQAAANEKSKTNTANDSSNIDLDSDDYTNNDSSPIRLAPGRFGQLWRKRRRCWSNFAHPKLTGMASSPGHEAVWRTMDRARIVGFVDLQNNDNDDGGSERDSPNDTSTLRNMHIVLEFRADGFVVGQIPRVISALVAMTNGWIPQNFFDVATRPDAYIPSKNTAPPFLDKRLYFHTARYHFHELTGNGDENFAKTIHTESESEQNWEADLRKRLMGGATSSMNRKEEDSWLAELRDLVSPELRQLIQTFETDSIEDHTHAADDAQDTSTTTLPYVDTDAPIEYSITLDLLRDIVSSGKWPATSDARSRVIKSPNRRGSSSGNNIVTNKKGALASAFPGNTISSGSFTVVNDQIWDDSDMLPLGNALFPELTKAVFDLEKEIIRRTSPPLFSADGMDRQSPTSLPRSPSTHCAVNRNAQFTPHVDSGRGQGQSVSMIAGLGNFTGGEILVEGKAYGIRYNALEFDGWKQLHWTAPFKGERYSLVWFTPDVTRKDGSNKPSGKQGEKLPSLDDQHAIRLAQEHSKAVPMLPPLTFRHDSTDGLVINELLDPERGSAYTMKPHTNMPSGFSLQNHDCVLDIGAHIGVASRLAIAGGCKHIIAYEPEPSNFELLSQNLDISKSEANASDPTIELHSAAVAHRSSESRTLVQARHENSGKQNTWRHSLEEYSQYVDRSTQLPSKSQKKTLQRFSVPCISFFGDSSSDCGVKQNGALVPGVKCVKLDCEGAEIDILLSNNASQASSWLDTTHLVVEWSFTKERRVSIFHKAMDNLRQAGFEVFYEGIGSWWDTDAGVMWPYPKDLIIFGIKNE